MAKTEKNKFQWLWVIIPVAIAVLFASYYLSKNNLSQSQTESGPITQEEAITKVKALPEVKDYLKRVPQGLTAANGEEENSYLIQVYEFKDGHTATFNWYKVDKNTGAVRKEF